MIINVIYGIIEKYLYKSSLQRYNNNANRCHTKEEHEWKTNWRERCWQLI